MKIESCTKPYLKAMVTMPSSSKEQNAYIKECIQDGSISLSQCIILHDEENVYARIIVDEMRNYLGSITIEDISESELQTFLQYVIKHIDPTKEYRCDLYADKIHYETIRRALQTICKVEIHRESYVVHTSRQHVNAQFKAAKDIDEDMLLSLFVEVSKYTFDTLTKREMQQKTDQVYCKSFMQDLLNDEESDKLFQVLCIDHKPIGFISVNRLLNDVGGIGYIGVLKDYWHHHYSTLLLKKAMDLAYQNQIMKLIGDIDENNFPIRYNLLQTGFELDCKQTIFII